MAEVQIENSAARFCFKLQFHQMRKFLILLSREIKSYFYSPIAYVVLCFFLLMMGMAFYMGLLYLSSGPTEVTVVESFFNTVPFWFGFVLIFPLITMRLFAEEFKLGTIESLMTAPVTDAQVVLSKFCGAVLFYVILCLPTVAFFYVFHLLTKSPAANAPGAYCGAYLMLFLMGTFYISIGCVASVITRDQIIAAVISFVAIATLFFVGLLGFYLPHVTPAVRDFLNYFSSIEHMGDFSRGMIDSRPIVYYLSMTTLMLVITYQIFQSRKWKL